MLTGRLLRTDDSYIYFDITDGQQAPLQCRINLVANEICAVGEPVEIEVQLFAKDPGREQPFHDVGAIKLHRANGSFILWWSPQKLLYEMLVKELVVETIGEPFAFLDFRVLYIGQAFSQKVWRRLTGHEKMQRILTMEGPIGASPEARAPFEVSLILLKATDFDEMVVVPDTALPSFEDSEHISHPIDLDVEGALEAFAAPFIGLGDEALTRDLEAQLIRYFRPPYNEVMFDNYPDIKGGMRSKGYSWSDFEISGLPASLSTDAGSTSVAFVVDSRTLTQRKAAGASLLTKLRLAARERTGRTWTVGCIGGFDLTGTVQPGRADARLEPGLTLDRTDYAQPIDVYV